MAALQPSAHAGPPQVRLTVQRVRGSEVRGRVAGSFQATVDVPQDAHGVIFYLDGQAVALDGQPPYLFRFDTDDYAKGEHRIEAAAQLANGSVAPSNSVSLDFRPHKWHLAVRQSMFFYVGLLILILAVAGLALRQFLRNQPPLDPLAR